ncbi:hypothetical protein [uncultured Desulfovibrio sp.]|uniref:hypothetical protein n=1 Tax=uncultured Desulfovibrio sp. TaxID=167968 RepID=UPI00039BADF6|nr:hypothetical protein [uncultured Desulfovibrio sp.]
MKNLLSGIVVLTILALAGIAVLAFWVGPQVEEQTRQEIAAVSEAVSIPGQLQFSRPDVKEIKFSPFSRRLTLRGAEIRGEMPPLAGSSLRYTLEEASFRIPLRMLLVYTPLRDMVLSEKSMMTVGEDIRISNFASAFSQGSISTRSMVRSEEADAIRLESSLVRELLEGKESLDMLNAVYHMGIGEIRASSITSGINISEQGMRMEFNCDSMLIRNWEGRSMEKACMDGIFLKKEEQEFLRLGNITVTGCTLPEEATVRELLTLAARPKPNERALQALLLRMFTTGEPLVREISAMDLRVPLDGQDVIFKNFTLTWPSNTSLKYGLSLDKLSLPTALVERGSGLSLPGLPALVLDAKLDFAAQGNGSMHVSAQNLGALEYDFVISGGATPASPHALFASALSDVRLKYTDQRLTAYLVSNVVPVAQAATPTLKAAIAQFCPGDSPENADLRGALETFATSPGVLEIRSKPGKNFRLSEAAGALAGGNPAALFSVTAQPGKKNLEEQINALKAVSAPAAQ